MIDSGNVTMPANNELVQCIAPFAPSGASTLTIIGGRDVHVFAYSSGYSTEWNGGVGWAQARKVTVGDHGVVITIPNVLNLCVYAQGPLGETVRVVVS